MLLGISKGVLNDGPVAVGQLIFELMQVLLNSFYH